MRPSIRASELDRILRCPGSLTLSRIVAAIDRDDGDEGSYLHWAIARRAIDELGAVEPEGGLEPPKVRPGFKLSPFSEWIVGWAIRLIQERVPADWSLMVEVPFFTAFPRWDNTGHADWVAISPDVTKAIGGDWKTGRDPIEPAETNEQFADYMMHIKASWPSIQSITFIGGQPRVSEGPEEEEGPERITEVTLEGEVLDSLYAVLDKRVCAVLDKPLELETGHVACRWCPAVLQCPALKAERDYMRLTMTPDSLLAIKSHPDDTTLADWLVSAKMLKQPMEDARELGKARIEAMGFITASHGTIVSQEKSRGSYKVVRPLELWDTLSGMLSREGLAKSCRWSVTALKANIAEEMQIPKTSKKGNSAEAVFDAQIRTHMEQGEKVTLVFQ